MTIIYVMWGISALLVVAVCYRQARDADHREG
jgi:hypothetical protein